MSYFCGLPADELVEIYEKHFDDHNFCFMVDRLPAAADVSNTNKCLINIDVADNRAEVSALIDPRVKGCSGNAVHAMNLLFGLHERIGLALKARGR